jgi:hypothetical protein
MDTEFTIELTKRLREVREVYIDEDAEKLTRNEMDI